METLVSVVLQQRPGDAVVSGIVQQNALPWLVGGRARAQGAAAAQTKSELQVPTEKGWGGEQQVCKNETDVEKREGQ